MQQPEGYRGMKTIKAASSPVASKEGRACTFTRDKSQPVHYCSDVTAAYVPPQHQWLMFPRSALHASCRRWHLLYSHHFILSEDKYELSMKIGVLKWPFVCAEQQHASPGRTFHLLYLLGVECWCIVGNRQRRRGLTLHRPLCLFIMSTLQCSIRDHSEKPFQRDTLMHNSNWDSMHCFSNLSIILLLLHSNIFKELL